MATHKLYRSRTDKWLGGVCAGLGNYLSLDTTVVRLLFILLFLLGGHGILVYLVMWLIIPPEPLPAPVQAVNPQ